MKINTFIILILGAILFSQCTPKNSQQIENNKMGKLVYIMDPQCGWCYGNKENISAIHEKYKNELDFEFMTGGMWIGENAPIGGHGLAQFMEANGPRMSQTTGVPLGKAFYELSKDSTYAFSSLEPSAAIVLVKEMSAEKAFEFSKEVHEAIFSEGKRLDKLSTYEVILDKLNLDKNVFKKEWLSESNLTKTQAEFAKASALANGFPTLILYNNNVPTVLASGYFNQEEMMTKINQLLE